MNLLFGLTCAPLPLKYSPLFSSVSMLKNTKKISIFFQTILVLFLVLEHPFIEVGLVKQSLNASVGTSWYYSQSGFCVGINVFYRLVYLPGFRGRNCSVGASMLDPEGNARQVLGIL